MHFNPLRSLYMAKATLHDCTLCHNISIVQACYQALQIKTPSELVSNVLCIENKCVEVYQGDYIDSFNN